MTLDEYSLQRELFVDSHKLIDRYLSFMKNITHVTNTTNLINAFRRDDKMADLSKIIRQVYSSLAELGGSPMASADRPEPAVPVKKSIHDDYIICLEDGKKLKMLKRHLKTSFNMTPEQYRERWNLGPDYPMVAPNYAKQRSSLAMKIGLGRKRKSAAKAA